MEVGFYGKLPSHGDFLLRRASLPEVGLARPGRVQGVLEQQGDVALARGAYNAGIEAAKRANDSHAQSELENALSVING